MTPHPSLAHLKSQLTLPSVRASALTQEAFIAELEAQIEHANAEGSLAVDQGKPEHECRRIERETYMMNLPAMTSRREVQLYIASVAQGIGNGYIKVPDAKVLIYMAQLALAAFGASNGNPPPPTPRLELNPRGSK